MNNLQSDDLMALSFLINEEIYVIKDEVKMVDATDVNRVKVDAINEEILTDINVLKAVDIEVETKVLESPSLQKTKEPAFKDLKYLGENNKYILIIVKEPSFEFLKQDDLGFLLKILAAKKLELKDVAIINLEKYNALNFEDLKAFFACNKIITFGINPQILQIEGAIANKKSNFKETHILGTWDLAKLQQDVKKKAIFWDELKSF